MLTQVCYTQCALNSAVVTSPTCGQRSIVTSVSVGLSVCPRNAQEHPDSVPYSSVHIKPSAYVNK